MSEKTIRYEDLIKYCHLHNVNPERTIWGILREMEATAKRNKNELDYYGMEWPCTIKKGRGES